MNTKVGIAMKMSERDLELCKLKENGVSGTELATKYDISRSRVYQIYNNYLALKHEDETSPPLKKLLASRMRDAMLVIFKDESIYTDPDRIMGLTLKDYCKYQNVGRKALESLVNGMLSLGYVKKNDRWLKW